MLSDEIELAERLTQLNAHVMALNEIVLDLERRVIELEHKNGPVELDTDTFEPVKTRLAKDEPVKKT